MELIKLVVDPPTDLSRGFISVDQFTIMAAVIFDVLWKARNAVDFW